MLEFPVNHIHYPSSDNEPMGENDVICWLMAASLDMLKRHFRGSDDVYVSSNSFVYYVEGDPTQRVAPDLYVVKGVPSHQRLNFKIWEEGVAPQVVFEFTTASSRYKDLGVKKGLYEALGVKEYYLFDPAEEYLKPAFRAFFAQDGVLVEQAHKSSHFSQELGLTISPNDRLLRFYPPDSLEAIPSSEELDAKNLEVQERADTAERRADRLEAELQELKKQLKNSTDPN